MPHGLGRGGVVDSRRGLWRRSARAARRSGAAATAARSVPRLAPRVQRLVDESRKIDFLGDRRALRRAFCVRARRAGPAKAQRERYDAATRVTTLNPAAAKMLGRN